MSRENTDVIHHRNVMCSVMNASGEARKSDSLFCRGFTLVELLMIVAIIGILSTLAIPSFTKYITTAKNSRCISDIRTLNQDISAWFLDNGTYPALYTDIPGRATLVDGWGRQYQYAVVVGLKDRFGELLNNDYDLYSKGADGISASVFDDATCTDDITLANYGSYVGLRP